MPGTVIQGCFPHGVKVTGQPHAAVSPSWVQQRIAASGRATSSVTQPKAAAPRVSPNGTAIPLPPHVALPPATGGRPLEPHVRQRMEAAFGQRFGDVRIHVGPHAQSIGARAFTHGNEIHFAPGQYNPGTPRGRQVLAHELAHVVQQRTGRVQNPFGSGVAVVQNATLEAEAERMGQRAAMQPPPAVRPLQAKFPGRQVVQRVRAFRVDSTPDARKVEIADGKLVAFQGQEHGIDISFGDSAHSDYYFKNKDGEVLDEWDLPDDLYEAIVHRMRFPAERGQPKDVKKKAWDLVKNLSAPVNSSDQFVREGSLTAPHFGGDWIPVLTKACKGKAVTRITAAQYFGPKDTTVVDIYLSADANGPKQLQERATYGEFMSNYESIGGYEYELV
ncbi:MAG: hypothetical protein QOJ98_1176 [Acidobacteriota bacterium]|jgi:hypothetical protein|nr:hypothetical protein [Acidobacteriota bacterium]